MHKFTWQTNDYFDQKEAMAALRFIPDPDVFSLKHNFNLN